MTFLGAAGASATPGQLDPEYGNGGTTTTSIGTSATAAAIAIQADGKVVVAGTSDDDFALARYQQDGTLDPSFGTGGIVTRDPGGAENLTGLGLQSDGRIVVGGMSGTNYLLTVFGAGGNLVTWQFFLVGSPQSSGNLAIQSDGKILFVGTSSNNIALFRFNADIQSLDSSFNGNGTVIVDVGGGTLDIGNAVAVQEDGKILVAGSADGDFAIIRFNSNGTLDTSFNSTGIVTTDTGATDDAHAIALQEDGKILVVGSSGSDFAVLRYNGDGALDTSFGSTGIVTTDSGQTDTGSGLALQSDGRVLVAGTSGSDFALLRYNADGELDTTFGADGLVTTAIGSSAAGNGLALQSDGKAVVVGESDNDFALARYLTGSPSNSTQAAFADFTYVLPDGRECTSISPQRVQVGTMHALPGEDALCQTSDGSLVAGWVIPVPQGFTGYGSVHEPFPPGLPVRVIESQRFTLVPFEQTLQIDYDANIAMADACTPADVLHGSQDGRVEYVWVPRVDFSMARTPSQAPCQPEGHELVGWSTSGDGTGEVIGVGEPLPEDWATHRTNHRTLYAIWRAA